MPSDTAVKDQGFDFDLYGPDFIDEPWETWRKLRDDHPAFHYVRPPVDAWLLTRYDSILAADKDWETWSSAQGNLFPEDNPIRAGRTLGASDPPRHDEMRRVLTKAFTPGRLARLEDRVRQDALQIMLPLVEEPEFDFALEYTALYPGIVIGRLLGLPDADVPMVLEWMDARHGPDPVHHYDDLVSAQAQIYEYLGDLVDDLRKHPRDLGESVLNDLVMAEAAGAPVSDAEIVRSCAALLTAGFGTTRRALGNLLVMLARLPDVRQRLRDDPSLIPAAFEESVRYESPTHMMARTTTRDVDVHGITVPAGSRVGLCYGSANRDERVFPDPDRFDIERSFDKRHLGFGMGVHFCLGAPLARVEARVTFEEILPRLGDYEVDVRPEDRFTTPTFRGYKRIRCVPGRRSRVG